MDISLLPSFLFESIKQGLHTHRGLTYTTVALISCDNLQESTPTCKTYFFLPKE